MTWATYKRKGLVELRPYVPGESLDGVSIAFVDNPPEVGDMIARNPDDPADQWLVGREFFAKHFEPATVADWLRDNSRASGRQP